MKKVVIFGAAGYTGKYITRRMMKKTDIELSVFVRNPDKFSDMDMNGVNIIKGDALNYDDVKNAMNNQDIMLCSLDGDILAMAQNIVNALNETSVKRIVWITGMGIHHEITGERGIILAEYAKQRPEYIKAADLIAQSNAVTTLLRCPGIQDGDNVVYHLTTENEQPLERDVDRSAIAQCMADIVTDESIGANDSLGITN